MKVKCISNNLGILPNNIQKYAFTQDEAGRVDLTIDKEYVVYGVRNNSSGKFFLILTDSVHNQLPWWMPANFFQVDNTRVPDAWTEKTFGWLKKDNIKAHPAYFEGIEEIEDGTEKGHEIFKIMSGQQ